ncbi:3-deoxy-7-phosphoheptulonate synthase [Candidatus Sumerlaeota bacterium]|nr:3-deoxy-7-phosphoheptulonate synthase [Candidatus Sumerlaeota bacterium]
MELTDNVNIVEIEPLIAPEALKAELPMSESHTRVVLEGRRSIQRILAGDDARRMAIVGPCSVHDPDAALEFARRLRRLQDQVGERVVLVMRAYFEKPRTSVGWKGMLYDPYLDNSDDMQEGFRRARRLLLAVAELGLPSATELLDPIVPQYLCDLVSWAAIGARTTESQIHRQMASGLSMPIGFKNSTDGTLASAIDGIRAARSPHAFLGITGEGRVAKATTRGNRYGHLVHRGGVAGPNYAAEYVAFTEVLMRKAGLPARILIDCSHDNSRKDPKRQATVFLDVVEQLRAGNRSIVGTMLESFLEEGNQPLCQPPSGLKYGLSITDKCLGWEETEGLIRKLDEALASLF